MSSKLHIGASLLSFFMLTIHILRFSWYWYYLIHDPWLFVILILLTMESINLNQQPMGNSYKAGANEDVPVDIANVSGDS